MSALKTAPAVRHTKRPRPQPGAGRLGRVAASGLVASLLFSATMFNNELYDLFGAGWDWLLAVTHLAPHLPAVLRQGGGLTQAMNHPHSVLAVLTYSLFYLGLCALLLHLLLPLPAQRRLAWQFYAGAGLVAVALLVGSRLGQLPTLGVLGSQVLHFLVSPLPVIGLVPLLRWHSAQAGTPVVQGR